MIQLSTCPALQDREQKIDLTLLWQERTSQQRVLAVGTAEAFFSCMPVLPIICHLALVNPFNRTEKTSRMQCVSKIFYLFGALSVSVVSSSLS